VAKPADAGVAAQAFQLDRDLIFHKEMLTHFRVYSRHDLLAYA
jgi:hypothetical protein